MKKIIITCYCLFVCISLSGQSLLLEKGSQSNGFGLTFATNDFDKSIGGGWIRSEYQFEVGVEYTYGLDSEVSSYGIFGNYYVLRQDEGFNVSAGLQFASARNSFATQYALSGIGGLYYVIPSESIEIIPLFQIAYSRNLTEGFGGENYGVGVRLGFPVGGNKISVTPSYTLKAPQTFGISVIYQMIR